MNKLLRRPNLLLPPIIIVIFSIVFRNKITEIITSVFVKPLLSTLDTSTLIIDTTILLGCFFIIVYFIFKALKGVIISPLLEVYILVVVIEYSLYRFPSYSEYVYVHFQIKFLNDFYLGDILFAPLFGIFSYHTIILVKTIFSKKAEINEAQKFHVDSPIELDESNDLYGRKIYLVDIKNKILATETPNHSFAIGIIGKWGSGKTTFIKSLKKEMGNENDIIQLQFNPWLALKAEGISPIFFSDLSSKLSEYDHSLKRQVLNYSNELIQLAEGAGLKLIKKIFTYSIADRDLEFQREEINESILSLNKKIIIYIDDVDRLHKSEILEVLKLIRNTASFSNTYFIVAFDRSYVIKSIGEALINNTEMYLEKIFQLEYYLPISPNKNLFQKSIINELKRVINKHEHIEILEKLFEPGVSTFLNYEVIPPINKYIKSFRDVYRFMNIFLLNYDKIKHNIYLPDYISICILRLKYPDLYQDLYYKKYEFLSTPLNSIFGESSGKLTIQFEDKSKQELEDSILYKYISNKKEQYALTDDDCNDSLQLVYSIFGSEKKLGSIDYKRTFYNSDLTITSSSCFERYFDCSMEGRLDSSEFEQALDLPVDELLQKISDWVLIGSFSIDLQLKLENYSNFDNPERFEKIVKAIVHFANLNSNQNTNSSNGFNFEIFYKILGGGNTPQNERITLTYQNDIQKYKKFVTSLFQDIKLNRKWNFINEFGFQLINEHNDNFILTHQELKELMINEFLEKTKDVLTLDKNIWEQYSNLIRHFSSSKNGEQILPAGLGIKINDRIKEIIANDVNKFLRHMIYSPSFSNDEFQIVLWDEVVFGSHENFEIVLSGKEETDEIKEYRDFYNKWVEAGKRSPIPYHFKYIFKDI